MIGELVEFARKIANGEHETLTPGMDQEFPEAAVEGDAVWQGDLGIAIASDEVPRGYKQVEVPEDRCLVPQGDTTVGSRHCLESADGVTMWVPSTWNEESLEGPYLQFTNGLKVTHPTHGDVTIPKCFNAIQIGYQREWDAEQARERRAAD